MTDELKALKVTADTYDIYADWAGDVSRLELHTVLNQIVVLDPALLNGSGIMQEEKFFDNYEWLEFSFENGFAAIKSTPQEVEVPEATPIQEVHNIPIAVKAPLVDPPKPTSEPTNAD